MENTFNNQPQVDSKVSKQSSSKWFLIVFAVGMLVQSIIRITSKGGDIFDSVSILIVYFVFPVLVCWIAINLIKKFK